MAAHNDRRVAALVRDYRAGRISRRELLGGMVGLGLSAAAIGGALGAAGLRATPADARAAVSAQNQGGAASRALEAAAQIAAESNPEKLTILHPAGSLGNLAPFVPEWEEAVGVPVEFVEVPLTEVHTKGMEEAVTRTGRYDLMLPSPISLPDFAEANLIVDLTDWVEKYNPEIDNGDSPVIKPLYLHGNQYKGRVYGLCTDGDVWSLFMRRDMLEDPEEQAAFQEQYGRELAAPNTWAEYYDLVNFFNRPDEGFYGGLEYRSRYYVKWEWMQKFVSKGRLYFDDQMKPLVNTPEGLEALQEMIDLTPALAPETKTWGWSENYAGFGSGQAFCTFSWPSFCRYNLDPKISTVSDKMAYGVVPGTEINGELVRAAMFCFSWSWTVNNHSKHPELAYLLAQWYYSPEVSTKSVPQPGGYFDPFRSRHFEDPGIIEAYTQEFLDVVLQNDQIAVPDFCIRGGFEYQEALDKNLHEALSGSKEPQQALDDAAAEMEEITERLGRDNQIQGWLALKETFPESILNNLKA